MSPPIEGVGRDAAGAPEGAVEEPGTVPAPAAKLPAARTTASTPPAPSLLVRAKVVSTGQDRRRGVNLVNERASLPSLDGEAPHGEEVSPPFSSSPVLAGQWVPLRCPAPFYGPCPILATTASARLKRGAGNSPRTTVARAAAQVVIANKGRRAGPSPARLAGASSKYMARTTPR